MVRNVLADGTVVGSMDGFVVRDAAIVRQVAESLGGLGVSRDGAVQAPEGGVELPSDE